MNSHKTISDYKSQAKEQLLGNYSMAIGSFVVIFVIVYTISVVLVGAGTINNASLVVGLANDSSSTNIIGEVKREALSAFLNFVVGAFSSLLMIGFYKILINIKNGREARMSDIFWGFKNHPDKVLIIYFVLAVFQYVMLIPSKIVGYFTIDEKGQIDGVMFFCWITLYVLAFLGCIWVYIIYAFRYLLYIDNPEMEVKEYFRCSRILMRGNKFRYAYMILSLIGYYLLGLISLGIGLLWIEPYKNMLVLNMYEDALVSTSSNGGAINED